MTDIERFISECTEPKELGWIALTVLRRAYAKWAAANNAQPMTPKPFILECAKHLQFRQKNMLMCDRFEGVKLKAKCWPKSNYRFPVRLDTDKDSW